MCLLLELPLLLTNVFHHFFSHTASCPLSALPLRRRRKSGEILYISDLFSIYFPSFFPQLFCSCALFSVCLFFLFLMSSVSLRPLFFLSLNDVLSLMFSVSSWFFFCLNVVFPLSYPLGSSSVSMSCFLSHIPCFTWSMFLLLSQCRASSPISTVSPRHHFFFFFFCFNAFVLHQSDTPSLISRRRMLLILSRCVLKRK